MDGEGFDVPVCAGFRPISADIDYLRLNVLAMRVVITLPSMLNKQENSLPLSGVARLT